MRIPIGRKTILSAAALAAVAVAGTAYATIPDGNGVIHGCVSKSAGALRVIDDATGTCSSKETSLNWNAKGIQGEKGDTGPVGPSDAYVGSHNSFELLASDNAQHEVLSIALPEGPYALSGKVNVFAGGGQGEVACFLNVGGNTIDEGRVIVNGASNAEATIALASVGGLASTGTSTVSCRTPTSSMYVWGVKIVAIKVGAFHLA
jgi:hypothetical protein